MDKKMEKEREYIEKQLSELFSATLQLEDELNKMSSE
jgi:hypothetical protein